MPRPTLSKQEIQTIRIALYALVNKYNSLVGDRLVADSHKSLYRRKAEEAAALSFRLGEGKIE